MRWSEVHYRAAVCSVVQYRDHSLLTAVCAGTSQTGSECTRLSLCLLLCRSLLSAPRTALGYLGSLCSGCVSCVLSFSVWSAAKGLCQNIKAGQEPGRFATAGTDPGSGSDASTGAGAGTDAGIGAVTSKTTSCTGEIATTGAVASCFARQGIIPRAAPSTGTAPNTHPSWCPSCCWDGPWDRYRDRNRGNDRARGKGWVQGRGRWGDCRRDRHRGGARSADGASARSRSGGARRFTLGAPHSSQRRAQGPEPRPPGHQDVLPASQPSHAGHAGCHVLGSLFAQQCEDSACLGSCPAPRLQGNACTVPGWDWGPQRHQC